MVAHVALAGEGGHGGRGLGQLQSRKPGGESGRGTDIGRIRCHGVGSPPGEDGMQCNATGGEWDLSGAEYVGFGHSSLPTLRFAECTRSRPRPPPWPSLVSGRRSHWILPRLPSMARAQVDGEMAYGKWAWTDGQSVFDATARGSPSRGGSGGRRKSRLLVH